MHVVIVGAGLAGLLLAQGLQRRGVEVTVLERDAGPDARRQGYRITVDRHGVDALQDALPPALFERVLATSGPTGGFFRITDERLRDAVVVAFDGAADAERQVDRTMLRSILLTGLGDRVRWGTPVAAVRDRAASVVVTTAGGEEVEADFLVVADGIGSALSAAVYPQSTPVSTGAAGIYGRVPLLGPRGRILPDALLESGVLAILPAPGLAFFMTAMRFPEGVGADYVMWGFVPPAADVGALTGASPAELLERTAVGVARAHPVIRDVVAGSEAPDTLLSRFSAGRMAGPRAIARAAVIGDAIHPMPPLGSHGGNTALRDAALLARLLAEGGDPVASSDAFHAEMVEYAAPEVADAERQTRRLLRRGVGTWMLRRVLPLRHPSFAAREAAAREAAARQAALAAR